MASLYTDLRKIMPEVLILSGFLTLCLRCFVTKDHILKIFMLGLGISLVVCVNLQPQMDHDFRIQSLNKGIVVYVAVLGFTSIVSLLIGQLFKKTANQDKHIASSQILRAQSLIGVSLLFLPALAIYYLSYEEYQHLFISSTFYVSVLIILFALIFISLVDKLASRFVREQVFRRKLFHVGPIVIIPIIYEISQHMLVAILSGGFFAFFALEVIRYCLNQLKTTYKVKSEEGSNKDSQNYSFIIRSVFSLLAWMETFNRRQKGFWFTHLFLILSLHLSYSLALLYPSQINGSVVLAMIAADGMAALIGKRYGNIKIYKQKTLEGTLSFIFTLFLWIEASNYFGEIQASSISIFLVAVICSIGELLGGDADNLVTLIFFYAASYAFH